MISCTLGTLQAPAQYGHVLCGSWICLQVAEAELQRLKLAVNGGGLVGR